MLKVSKKKDKWSGYIVFLIYEYWTLLQFRISFTSFARKNR